MNDEDHKAAHAAVNKYAEAMNTPAVFHREYGQGFLTGVAYARAKGCPGCEESRIAIKSLEESAVERIDEIADLKMRLLTGHVEWKIGFLVAMSATLGGALTAIVMDLICGGP